MPTADEFVDLLLTQDGDEYIFGVEVSPDDANPAAFDCSELVEWGLERLGIAAPDGSWLQCRWVKDNALLTSVDRAALVRGALLFKFSSSPFSGGRPTSAHVAVSQGNHQTIEARSSRHGVGQFSAMGRGWTHAGLVPGLSYEEDTVAQFTDEQAEYLAANADEMLAIEARPRSEAHNLTFYRVIAARLGIPGDNPELVASELLSRLGTGLPAREVVTIVRGDNP